MQIIILKALLDTYIYNTKANHTTVLVVGVFVEDDNPIYKFKPNYF